MDDNISSKFSEVENLYNTKKQLEALALLDDILKIEPDNEMGLRNKGIISMNFRKYEQSIELMDKLLENNPDDTEILCRKSVSLEMLGKHVESLKYLDRVLKIEPDNEIAKNGLKCVNYLENKENF